MDKNAIKKYAVWARRELIARVSQKAEQYGITEKEIIDERAENIHGVVLTPAQKSQRQALIHLIRRDGYQQAMEEVAYTWFNRFIALRFMEVNDYLPGHTRAFTDEQNAFKPRILSDALSLELTGLTLDKVIELKETNKTEELYQYLLITLCNHLSAILPGMFQRIDDYTELLFPEHLLREGSVLEQLVTMIPQEDWLDAVQIIGWLYQYYNAEPKDQVFANLKKNIKISKKDIPAATQLFTPDWIVRYMVENSLGRLWVEGHPNDSLKAGWKYYMEEAEQEPEVQAQLQEIRSEYAHMKPEDILCIDPCSGSGHILVYLFDVLVQIYEAYGYPTRDAVASIVQNNLWGLDIDDRAAQLAYFAVMMKARQYDKGWFRRGIEPHVFALQDSGDWPTFERQIRQSFANHPSLYEDASIKVAKDLFDSFADAKEYGSIIQPDVTLDDLAMLEKVLDEMQQQADLMDFVAQADAASLSETLRPMIQQARALVQKYHAVVTNPPYMGASGMNDSLSKYIRTKYADYKSDFFSSFIVRASEMTRKRGYCGFFTPYVWMFIQSYEKLREYLYNECCIETLIQCEYSAFEEATVPVCTFVFLNGRNQGKKGCYLRLTEFRGGMEIQKQRALEGISNHLCGYFFAQTTDSLSQIPGMPLAYWAGSEILKMFSESRLLSAYGEARSGLQTSDNNRFLRFWFEVSSENIETHCTSHEYALMSNKKWYPMTKGGEYRRWYGNLEYVVNWQSDGQELYSFAAKLYGSPTRIIKNTEYYFEPCLTWSHTTSKKVFAARWIEPGIIFNVEAPSLFRCNDPLYFIANLNSIVATAAFSLMNQTFHFLAGDVAKLPVIYHPSKEINRLADDSIQLSRTDWDSFEASWDFQIHPLVRWIRDRHNAQAILPLLDQYNEWKQANPEKSLENDLQVEASSTVELSFNLWRLESFLRFQHLKANEEELNRIFIDIYGLQDELTPEVADKDVTVRQADLGRDIRSLVSYAVGCMLGRYSLDKPGLVFAGGEWDAAQYVTYPADKDGVLPITDDDYFSDDVVSMFVDWVKTVFGPNELEDNLKFIATALYPNSGGTARELIRQYFLNDFYKEHLKIYQKRPIYWLFDAGKKNSFKCLIYLHRYQPDTVARVRTDYVHEMQARYRTAMEDLAHRVDTASGSERVRLQKQLVKIQGQEEELRKYEEIIHHYADMMLPLDLDDGVKVNYAKLADVLAPIK